jgi:hypothetical protein
MVSHPQNYQELNVNFSVPYWNEKNIALKIWAISAMNTKIKSKYFTKIYVSANLDRL